MKYTKTLIGLIASVMILTGCTSGGKTAVTIYDKDGAVVQETTKDAVMLNSAYTMAVECNKAKIAMAQRTNLGVIDPMALSKMAPTAQAEYMRTLPMIHMAGALKAATARTDDGCQKGLIAYYNHLNVEKQANTSLWLKGLGIAGFVGGAYVIGNTVEGIVGSIANSGGVSNVISGSRVNMDSGNNYNSPGGIANASSSGDGLGTNNLFTRGNDGTIYAGNQPRGTTTELNDQNGTIDFGSNSGDNAEQVVIPVVPPVEPVE